jgi:hypothetical protein
MKLTVPPSGRRRSILTTAVLVTTFALSGVAAWALTSSSSDLTQPERIAQIARGEGIEVDAASVEVTVSEVAPYVVGATIEVVEYDSSLGRCEDLVVSLDSETASVGHCGDADAGEGASLSNASLGGGGVSLNGRFLQIIQGRVSPDAFPPGTTVQAELLDGRLVVMPIRVDGRFFRVAELATAPSGDDDTLLLPSEWRAVAADGSVIETYVSVVPTFPVEGP